MSLYRISSAQGTHEYDSSTPFLQKVEGLLEQGIGFMVHVLQGAVHVLEHIKKLLQQHGVSVTLDATSQPEAADYVVNILAGSVVGGVGMGAAGTVTWAGLRGLGLVLPAAAPFIAAASLIGMAMGAAGGAVATRWGLRVHFSATGSQKRLVMDLRPQ